jgi:undecaprenyl diphosphate synthase
MYCLSTENWTRPSEEVDVILRVIQHVILKKLDYAHQHKVGHTHMHIHTDVCTPLGTPSSG